MLTSGGNDQGNRGFDHFIHSDVTGSRQYCHNHGSGRGFSWGPTSQYGKTPTLPPTLLLLRASLSPLVYTSLSLSLARARSLSHTDTDTGIGTGTYIETQPQTKTHCCYTHAHKSQRTTLWFGGVCVVLVIAILVR